MKRSIFLAALLASGCQGQDLDHSFSFTPPEDLPGCWEHPDVWNAPGEQLAFTVAGASVLADLATGEQCRLTALEDAEGWVHNEAVGFAPDGRSYAFFRQSSSSLPLDLYYVDNSDDAFISRSLGIARTDAEVASIVPPLFSGDGARVLYGRFVPEPCDAPDPTLCLGEGPFAGTVEVVSRSLDASCSGDARDGCEEIVARFDRDSFNTVRGLTWVSPSMDRGDDMLLVALADGIYPVPLDYGTGLPAEAREAAPIPVEARLFDPAILPGGQSRIAQGLSWSGRFVAFAAHVPIHPGMGGFIDEGPTLFLYTSVEWNPESCIAAGPDPQFGNPPCIQPMSNEATGTLHGAYATMSPDNDGRLFFKPWDSLESAAEANTGTGPQMDWTPRDLPAVPAEAYALTPRPRR